MAVFLLQGRPAGIPKQSKRSELRGEKRPGKDCALTGVFRHGLQLLKIQCESHSRSRLGVPWDGPDWAGRPLGPVNPSVIEAGSIRTHLKEALGLGFRRT